MSIIPDSLQLAAASDRWQAVMKALTDESSTPFLVILVAAVVLLSILILVSVVNRKVRARNHEAELKAERARTSLNNPFSKAS